jgi:hypothetical protein
MSRSIRMLLKLTAMLAWVAGTATLLVSPAHAQRHHIALGLGYTKLLSDDLKDESIGVDFTNAGNGGLGYRYSVNQKVDVTIDSDATVSGDSANGVDLTLTNSFFGPGVRYNLSESGARPFLQANFYWVSENIELEQGGVTVSSSESGAGFGLAGGFDISASRLISFPLKVHYLYGKPADDVSGVGFNAAIAFNFGADF